MNSSKKVLRDMIGDDGIETLEKAIFKRGTSAIIDPLEYYFPLMVVPRTILAWLVSNIKPLKVGEHKEFSFPGIADTKIYVEKQDIDQYRAEFIKAGRVIHSFDKQSLPAVSGHMMTVGEIYESFTDEKEAPKAESPKEELDDTNAKIKKYPESQSHDIVRAIMSMNSVSAPQEDPETAKWAYQHANVKELTAVVGKLVDALVAKKSSQDKAEDALDKVHEIKVKTEPGKIELTHPTNGVGKASEIKVKDEQGKIETSKTPEEKFKEDMKAKKLPTDTEGQFKQAVLDMRDMTKLKYKDGVANGPQAPESKVVDSPDTVEPKKETPISKDEFATLKPKTPPPENWHKDIVWSGNAHQYPGVKNGSNVWKHKGSGAIVSLESGPGWKGDSVKLNGVETKHKNPIGAMDEHESSLKIKKEEMEKAKVDFGHSDRQKVKIREERANTEMEPSGTTERFSAEGKKSPIGMMQRRNSLRALHNQKKPNLPKSELLEKPCGIKKDAADPALAPKDVKVKELQQKIDSNSYKPDAKKIAEKVIQSGDLKIKEEEMDKAEMPKGAGMAKKPAPAMMPKPPVPASKNPAGSAAKQAQASARGGSVKPKTPHAPVASSSNAKAPAAPPAPKAPTFKAPGMKKDEYFKNKLKPKSVAKSEKFTVSQEEIFKGECIHCGKPQFVNNQERPEFNPCACFQVMKSDEEGKPFKFVEAIKKSDGSYELAFNEKSDPEAVRAFVLTLKARLLIKRRFGV